MGETALRLAIIVALSSFFTYRIRKSKFKKRSELAESGRLHAQRMGWIQVAHEDAHNFDWTTFEGDPRLQQAYFISRGLDEDSAYYEVKQYQEDVEFPGRTKEAEWSYPWLPGVDRKFALELTSESVREQHRSLWQTIFVLGCKHYLPSIHALVSVPKETYCFICRGLSEVIRIVSRKEIFPTEENSIQTREEWIRAVKTIRGDAGN